MPLHTLHMENDDSEENLLLSAIISWILSTNTKTLPELSNLNHILPINYMQLKLPLSELLKKYPSLFFISQDLTITFLPSNSEVDPEFIKTNHEIIICSGKVVSLHGKYGFAYGGRQERIFFDKRSVNSVKLAKQERMIESVEDFAKPGEWLQCAAFPNKKPGKANWVALTTIKIDSNTAMKKTLKIVISDRADKSNFQIKNKLPAHISQDMRFFSKESQVSNVSGHQELIDILVKFLESEENYSVDYQALHRVAQSSTVKVHNLLDFLYKYKHKFQVEWTNKGAIVRLVKRKQTIHASRRTTTNQSGKINDFDADQICLISRIVA